MAQQVDHNVDQFLATPVGRRAVLALPEPLRFAVTARYWAGLTSPEIARLEGVSPVGARKRLLRALSSLERTLVSEVSR